MDISVRNLYVFEIGGVEVWITETIVATWIIMLILIAFAVIVRIALKKFKDVPDTFQNIVETLVETCDSFIKTTAGGFPELGNWFFMGFAFIFLANIGGVLGMRAPTADWSMAFALALATFVIIQIMGLKYRKGAYLKTFFEPNPIFLPLNLIGELSRPVSLSFRLFGNALTGTILMTLIYSLAPMYLRFGIPAALHIYFDLVTGAIQTYIFCVLSLAFIGAAAKGNASENQAE